MPNNYKDFPIKRRYHPWMSFGVIGVLIVITLGFIVWKFDYRKLLTFVQPPGTEIGTAFGPEYNVASPSPIEEKTSFAAGSQATLSTELQRLLDLINYYRATNNIRPLLVSPTLNTAANWMANDMASHNYLSHTDSLGRDPFERMSGFGYDYNTWKGENLAGGCDSPPSCFELWKNSPGHNANLLNSNFMVIGLGKAYNSNSTYGWYWATEFGGYNDSPDSDNDGFADNVERYIGTDPLDSCPDNLNDPAWPFDIDNNAYIDVRDILKIAAAGVLLTKEGDPKFNRRYDLNANGKINVEDLLLYSAKKVLMTRCSN